MKINMKRTIYTAGLSAAVAAAALGLGGCGTGTQIPDTIKVQNVDAASNTITVIGNQEGHGCRVPVRECKGFGCSH